MKEPLRKKLNLPVIDIELTSGKVIKNYPDKGSNLVSVESIEEHLKEHEYYFITLGNYRTQMLSIKDIRSVKESK